MERSSSNSRSNGPNNPFSTAIRGAPLSSCRRDLLSARDNHLRDLSDLVASDVAAKGLAYAQQPSQLAFTQLPCECGLAVGLWYQVHVGVQ
ncbi:unnamed protein product [Protopolystoma xenopodis]|uniref:Uncharacterized protein n=1 Tax=Protopolystoma xenopodis TaxID=117903 RepID=A0A3S5A355_9PLAT|nr:unnamed protein product [Protopolystoma xenopodis]